MNKADRLYLVMGTIAFNKYVSIMLGKLSQVNLSKDVTPRLTPKRRIRVS